MIHDDSGSTSVKGNKSHVNFRQDSSMSQISVGSTLPMLVSWILDPAESWDLLGFWLAPGILRSRLLSLACESQRRHEGPEGREFATAGPRGITGTLRRSLVHGFRFIK